ncbi:MAG: DUF4364 family protein [Lachnospiraceae bacterium]|nr:DUF4364 family protein [Lachnospiraceae bacterium]
MRNNTLSIYKMMILYMLDRVDFELSTSQLSEFIVGKGYTNFFNFQQALNELEGKAFVRSRSIRNASHYKIEKSGRDTLKYFGDDLSEAIKREIDDYLISNELSLRKQSENVADYYRERAGHYIVTCSAKDHGEPIINMTLNVEDEDMAIAMCDNWQRKYADLYSYIIHELIRR